MSPELDERKQQLVAAGKFLALERADFGVLFRQMDAFIVHGGLGTTVEALRMRKPVAVTGVLLMTHSLGLCALETILYWQGEGMYPSALFCATAALGYEILTEI